MVKVDEVRPQEEAVTATTHPHRRRWPWVVGGLVVLVVGAALVFWFTTNRARPVTMSEAERAYGARVFVSPGGTTRPAPGVYRYTGSGTEHLSLPPLSQAEGPTMPGTVTLSGRSCFIFRIDYSTHHWETWNYCLHQGDLWETGGQSWQLWSVGPIGVTNLSSFVCAPKTMALPAEATPGERWLGRCTGTNTGVAGRTVSMGPYRFIGFKTLRIAGSPVRAAEFLRLRTESGAQRGTERSQVYFDLSNGLPLRVRQSISVTTATRFGTTTYTQTGVFTLSSLVVHR